MHKTGNALAPAAFALALVSALMLASAADAETKMCCFNNWRFAGTCIVQVGGNQVCGDVLGVLNNPMSAATTYCGGTRLRGRW